ncbi:MAG: hypothetical protein PHF37_06790 [Phycisphaerae bacterium]|nr:hypothetical protein [Phycisphaerae bacterium]
MKTRDRLISFFCIVIAAALLIAASGQLNYINSQRKEMKLISSDQPLKNAPPSLAFATVAMGAFRGLVVDILWMRADKLKEKGQFFDAKQLADWITTLQPRFASVWQFQAWNMAYNISVAIPAAQADQRWKWVKNGYELLRDQGIPLNPKSIDLYQELGRIFQHKIGDVTDDAHKYYKIRLAESIAPLLGNADEQFFDSLAATPKDLDILVSDPNVAVFLDALYQADSTFVLNDQLPAKYLSLRQNPVRFDPKVFEVLDVYRTSAAMQKFDVFAKAWQLRKVWKLEPEMMVQLNQTYGPIDWDSGKHLPLDWRHPDSHAIYWAVKGLEATSDNFNINKTNTDRIVLHSLQNLFRYGKIFIYESPVENDPNGLTERKDYIPEKDIFLRPDLRMFEPYNSAVMKVLEEYSAAKRMTVESLQNGHRNMLINAVLMFYQGGHEKHAQKIYEQLRSLYPRDEFKVSLIVFAKSRFIEEAKSIGIHDASEMILMLLREANFRYALRDDETAFSREQMAKEIYDHYNKEFDENRVSLPPFSRLKFLAVFDFCNDLQYPAQLRQSLLKRIQVERPELEKELREQETQFRSELEDTQGQTSQ